MGDGTAETGVPGTLATDIETPGPGSIGVGDASPAMAAGFFQA
jgi:hypothetical protein